MHNFTHALRLQPNGINEATKWDKVLSPLDAHDANEYFLK